MKINIIILLSFLMIAFLSCNKDNEHPKLNGEWLLKVPLEEGVGYVSMLYRDGNGATDNEEELIPFLVGFEGLEGIYYKFKGGFGGLSHNATIQCYLWMKINNSKTLLDEIKVENKTELTFHFEGETAIKSIKDKENIYIYLQIKAIHNNNNFPHLIGYDYEDISYTCRP